MVKVVLWRRDRCYIISVENFEYAGTWKINTRRERDGEAKTWKGSNSEREKTNIKKQILFVSDGIFCRNVSDGGGAGCQQTDGTLL